MVWALGVVWTVLGAISTLSLLFPKIGNYIPRWPWYVWVVSGLVIGIVALFEDTYGQSAILWKLTDPGCCDATAQRNASVLAELPVYPDTLRYEIITVCEGTKVSMETYVFVNTSIVSTVDSGIFKASLQIQTLSGNRYRGTGISDLSEWLLREEFFDTRFNATNARYVPLETVALRAEHLSAGKPERGWIGFEIPRRDIGTSDLILDKIEKATVEIEDGMGVRHRIPLPAKASWPATTDTIVHASIMS